MHDIRYKSLENTIYYIHIYKDLILLNSAEGLVNC